MIAPTTSEAFATQFAGVREVPGEAQQDADSGTAALLGYRPARAGELRDAYPSGTHDIELGYVGRPLPAELAEYTAALLAANPRCRRVVLGVPELELESIGWAEAGGYRYVIDVETISGEYSLLVTEPQWVLDQPAILEDIPLKE